MTLFDKIGTSVFETNMTRKITINGETKPYPVYKIKLNELFYNDKNDRIATIIDKYNKENNEKLIPGTNEEYNSIIQEFIIQSGEQAILKTKNNIKLIGQREAGIVLPDGRVVDGNRRFTCLRKLSTEDEKFNWYEAVILPDNADEKQIKLLELMIQHAEEQRIDYDPVDFMVGMYRDIKINNLLSEEEYASASDMPIKDIKNKIKMVEMFNSFLKFLNMQEHYYLAKEFSFFPMVSGIGERTSIITLLNRCDETSRQDFENIIYTSIALNIKDTPTYMESVSKMATAGILETYIKQSKIYADEFKATLDEIPPTSFAELKNIINLFNEQKVQLTLLLDENLLKQKKNEIHSKPSKNISKSTSLMKDIDDGVIERLTEKETKEFKENINKLKEQVKKYDELINKKLGVEKADTEIKSVDLIEGIKNQTNIIKPINKNLYYITFEYNIEPVEIVNYKNNNCFINVYKTLEIKTDAQNFETFFIDKNGNIISNKIKFDGNYVLNFELNSSALSNEICFLVIKDIAAPEFEISQLIKFKIKNNFSSQFNF